MCHQLKSIFLFEVYGWICFKIHGSEGIYNVEKLSKKLTLLKMNSSNINCLTDFYANFSMYSLHKAVESLIKNIVFTYLFS